MAAEALAALVPAAIVSSDATRALDTARALSLVSGVPVVPDRALREIDLGEWSGLTRAEVEARFPGNYADWLAGRDSPRGSGETYAEAGRRARVAVLAHLAAVDRPGPLVAVTHGGTGRNLVLDLLGIAGDSRSRLAPLGNARWAELYRRHGGWTLSAYNTGPDRLDSADLALDAGDPGWQPAAGGG